MATHKRCFPCLVILLLCSCLFIHISEFDPLKMMQRNFLFNIIFFSIRSECISKCLKRRWMCWKKLYSLLSNEWSMFYSLLLHWGILLKKNSPSSLSFEECDKAKFFKKSFENNPCFFFFCKFPVFFIHTSFSFPFLLFLDHRILSIANDYFFVLLIHTQFKLYFSNFFIFSFLEPKMTFEKRGKEFFMSIGPFFPLFSIPFGLRWYWSPSTCTYKWEWKFIC